MYAFRWKMTSVYICGNNSFGQIDGLLDNVHIKPEADVDEYQVHYNLPQKLPMCKQYCNITCTWSQIWTLTGTDSLVRSVIHIIVNVLKIDWDSFYVWSFLRPCHKFKSLEQFRNTVLFLIQKHSAYTITRIISLFTYFLTLHFDYF